jgi:flagellar biosynthesis/type III secretory pathway M-ring protein FliF/YscJ
MMLSNFLFRVRQYLGDNRARFIKWAIILAAAVLAIILIYGLVESVIKARYERRVQAYELELRDARERAKEAEARKAVIEAAIETKNAEIDKLEEMAALADKRLAQTRTIYLPLKEKYEEIRNTPVPDTPVSCTDVCAQLAELGYKCQ